MGSRLDQSNSWTGSRLGRGRRLMRLNHFLTVQILCRLHEFNQAVWTYPLNEASCENEGRLVDRTGGHFPRPLALAKPLPLVPRPLPRPAPPRVPVLFPVAPRLFITELGRDVDEGAPNLDEAREEVGKLETKEVSAVLKTMSSDHLQ